MPLTYEPKIRLILVDPDGAEKVEFLRGNIPVAEILRRFGYTKARHNGLLINGQELLKELADEYGLTLQVS